MASWLESTSLSARWQGDRVLTLLLVRNQRLRPCCAASMASKSTALDFKCAKPARATHAREHPHTHTHWATLAPGNPRCTSSPDALPKPRRRMYSLAVRKRCVCMCMCMCTRGHARVHSGCMHACILHAIAVRQCAHIHTSTVARGTPPRNPSGCTARGQTAKHE